MTPTGRTAGASALLVMGVADLVFLNVWAFPRTSVAERLALRGPQPGERSPSVAVARAGDRPPPAPAEPQPASPAPAPAPPTLALAAPPPPPSADPGEPASEPLTEPAPAPTPRPTRKPRSASAAGSPIRVYFRHDQHVVGQEAVAALRALVARGAPAGQLLIEGHTDTTGVELYNRWLSEQRASAVAEQLVAMGIPREQVIVRAHGSARPAVTGGEPQALRRNRRVEISFVQEVTGGR